MFVREGGFIEEEGVHGVDLLDLDLGTPAGICVKYGPCSRRRQAPVDRLQDKVVRTLIYARVDVHTELRAGKQSVFTS